MLKEEMPLVGQECWSNNFKGMANKASSLRVYSRFKLDVVVM